MEPEEQTQKEFEQYKSRRRQQTKLMKKRLKGIGKWESRLKGTYIKPKE